MSVLSKREQLRWESVGTLIQRSHVHDLVQPEVLCHFPSQSFLNLFDKVILLED